MKKMGPDPPVSEWISKNLEKASKIGYDPALVSAASAKSRTKFFSDKGYEFVPIEENLINKVWKSRPLMSQEKVFVHEIVYAGENIKQKLDKVLAKYEGRFLFTSVLDDIAWLVNLRGKDIDYNPLFFSYMLIDRKEDGVKIILFVNDNKVEGIRDYLADNNIEIHRYEDVDNYLLSIEEKIVIDENELNYRLYQKIKHPVHKNNIIARIKAIKTPREIQGFKDSHIRDAIAMVKYFSWLEEQLNSGVQLTEWTAALELDRLRSLEYLNMGLSFENISSSGPNAAIIHYAPTAETARNLSLNEIYLLDSGGQYLDGTIDTTRTMHFGTPTDREKECFTRVFLGNLDLERIKWPVQAHLTGNDIDVLARRRLWEVGLDYNHATGHGVGYYLNVHEGPHYLCKGADEEFKIGMNITNEPGYYEEGSFGIRIENVLLITESQTMKGWVEFENVTMVPYDKKLFDRNIMDRFDIEYVNKYHRKVWDTLSPILQERGECKALKWLENATSPF